MADRFPSIEEFSDGQTEARGDLHLDPATSTDADFLAREKAALGDDADFFATANDGLPADHSTTDANAAANNNNNNQSGDFDLLGGDGDGDGAIGDRNTAGGGGAIDDDDGGMADFQSSFPALDAGNSQVGPGGTITGSNEPFLSAPPLSAPYAAAEEEEPEPVREWREKRDAAIRARDELSARRKAETVKAAQAAIDDFYDNYNAKKEKSIAQTRREADAFLAARDDTATTAGGATSWERVARLVDLSGKGARGGAAGTGKERFRELLLSLRKDEHAPGATGY